LPQAAADTAVQSFPQTTRSAISLVAPFEGADEEASLSRPEVSIVAPQKGPVLVPIDGGVPVPLFGTSIVIGRDPDCDVCIASGQVSGKHCELRADGALWRVLDLGSKNGTQVNGAIVNDHILNPGDELTLARQHRFRINYPGDTRPGQGRLSVWLLGGMVAATLALTVYFFWRLIG
jgi:pSer/pThr/pTyr-binding forkhead associated (FHA) protein